MNRKRLRNQGPTNPCSATMTTERATWARNRALVSRFSSRSSRPTCGGKYGADFKINAYRNILGKNHFFKNT